ncbi:MAG: PKD domain-containing protein, partial [Deltaproteobacteria bacterium]|nr:PKD domain-containing protein [Deltaproteobacteria bacterium]
MAAKKVVLCVLAGLVFWSVPLWAQENDTVVITVGQENVFAEFNHQQAWIDPVVGVASIPDGAEAFVEKDYAYVAVDADPDTGATAYAGQGLRFEVDFAGYSPDEVLDWPVRVVFDYTYELTAYWLDWGSALAALRIPELYDGALDRADGIDIVHVQDSVKKDFTAWPDGRLLTVDDLAHGGLAGDVGLKVLIYCQAGSDYDAQTNNRALASLTLHSITVGFPGHMDNSTTTTTMPVDVTPGFVGVPRKGLVPLEVAFLDTTRAPVSSWLWDFGDGERSNEQNPVHIYTKPGLYSVGLTAAGPGGTAGETLKPDYILVEERAVGAGLCAAPVGGAPPLRVSFRDLSAGIISRWSWDFGDGQSSSEQ